MHIPSRIHVLFVKLIRTPLNIAWVGGILFLIIMSVLPQTVLSENNTGVGLDKLGRFLLFALLSFYPAAFFRSFKVALLVATSIAPFGFFLEVVQKSLPGRHFSPEDMIANNLGSILGIVVSLVIRFFLYTGDASPVTRKRNKQSIRQKKSKGFPSFTRTKLFLINMAIKLMPSKNHTDHGKSDQIQGVHRQLINISACLFFICILAVVLTLWHKGYLKTYLINPHMKTERVQKTRSQISGGSSDHLITKDQSSSKSVLASSQMNQKKDQVHKEQSIVAVHKASAKNLLQDTDDKEHLTHKKQVKRFQKESRREDMYPLPFFVVANNSETLFQSKNSLNTPEMKEPDRDQKTRRADTDLETKDHHWGARETQDVPGSDTYSLQIGAFQYEDNARQLAHFLEDKGYQVHIFPWRNSDENKGFKVSIGEYSTQRQAKQALQQFKATEKRNGLVIYLEK
jgi:cell division septation protein DedD